MGKEIGGHGCFFCGAAVRLQRVEQDRIFYVCTSCRKWVVVRVMSKTDAKYAKIVGSADHPKAEVAEAAKKNGGKAPKKAKKAAKAGS